MSQLHMPTITIRPAYADDAESIARLAILDSSVAPDGRLLLAEVEGELRAALSVDDGRLIADPFFPSADLAALLKAHAAAPTFGAPRSGLRHHLAAVLHLLGEGPRRQQMLSSLR